jgi:hypothetical protein
MLALIDLIALIDILVHESRNASEIVFAAGGVGEIHGPAPHQIEASIALHARRGSAARSCEALNGAL